MSLLNRETVRIGRAQREARDDRFFLVASEDEHAPRQYFDGLSFRRVKVDVLPTLDGRSAPVHVLDRLRDAYQQVLKQNQVQPGDEFWLLLDTDHWIKGTHLPGLLAALQQARQAGFKVAMSNPCFELWLMLHHAEVAPGTTFQNCEEVLAGLRERLSSYNKTKLGSDFPLERVQDAIARARRLESNPDAPANSWPDKAGSRVYLLLESILGGKTRV